MRIAKRLLHATLIVLTLVIGATAAAVIVSQTAWFKERLRGYIEREANQYLNGRLSIQRPRSCFRQRSIRHRARS